MPFLPAPGFPNTSQPKRETLLARTHWLTKDVSFAITGATPWFNSAKGLPSGISRGGTGFSQRGTRLGNALWTPNGGWADFAVNEDWAGPNTIIALCRVNDADNPWGGLFSKNSSGTTTQFAVGRFSSEDFIYGSVDDATALKYGGSSNVSTLTGINALTFTHSGVASTGKSYYVNGSLIGTTAALGTQPTGTGTLGLGRGRDSSASFDSDVDWINFIRVKRVMSAAEIAEIYRDPWALWEPEMPVMWFFPGAAGGTTYNQSLAGSITFTGALTKQTNKAVAGSSTPAGALSKLTSKAFGGSLTVAGGLVKQTAKSFTGSITGSGALSTMILFTASMGGSITPSGAIAKMTIKALAGASTFAGAISKMTAKGLGGEVTLTGALSRLTAKAFAGSVTVAGSLAESYQVLKSLAGSITPTGALGAVYIAFVAGVLKLLALMGVGQ